MNTKPGNPYIGPRTFREDESDRFFGREREANELLALVLSEQEIVFYAQSGAGKSSLVNTCLIPNLKKKGFEILHGRVGGDAPAGVEADNIFTFNLIRSLSTDKVNVNTLANQSLSKFLLHPIHDTSDRKEPGPNRRALIIDQFEELFSTHHEAWEKRKEFFEQLAQVMEEDSRLRVILVMREDYIALLDPYAYLLPSRLRMRYYMQQLEYHAALKAVKEPVKGRDFSRPYAEGAAEKLVDDLRTIKVIKPDGTPASGMGQFVEPLYLQVICYELWNNLPSSGTTITQKNVQDVGDVGTSLGMYYAKRVEAVAEAEDINESKIRKWFTDKLISPTGIRNMVLQEPGETSAHLENRVIQALSDLVRAEQRGGGVFYELTHDRLVDPIIVNNRNWFDEHLSPLQKQAALWDGQGRKDSWLLSDEALAEVEQWAGAHPDELTDIEREYLEECRNMQARIEERHTAERQQLEMANKLAAEQTRSARRAMWGNVIAGILLVIAIITTVLSLQKAEVARIALETARSSQISTIALDRSSNQIDLAILLGLQANSISNTFETRKTLLTILQKAGRYRGALVTSGQNIQNIQLNPNGKTFAMLDDQGVTLWDFEGNELGGPFLGPASPIFATAFSPDGKIMASSGKDGSIIVWDAENWTRLSKPLTDHTEWVNSLVFSKDGKTLVSASDDATIIIWNVEDPGNPQKIHTIESDFGVNYATISPTQNILAAADAQGLITWWNISDLSNPIMMGPNPSQSDRTILGIVFSPDGRYLASGDLDGMVYLWAVSNPSIGIKVGEIEDFTAVYSIAVSPDGRLLALGTETGGIALWDISEPQKAQRLADSPKEHISEINSISFSPDGKTFASGGADGKIILWDLATRQPLDSHLSDAVLSPVNSVTFNPKGDMLVSAINNGSIVLWDVSTRGKLLKIGKSLQGSANMINRMEYSADGSYLTLFSTSKNFDKPDDEFIAFFDVNNGSMADTGLVKFEDASGAFLMYQVSDEDEPEPQTRLFDRNAGILPGKSIPGEILFITPDKRFVTYQTIDEDGVSIINLWDRSIEKTIGQPVIGNFLALSQDGKTLVYETLNSDDESQIVFWDVDQSVIIKTLENLYLDSDPVASQNGTVLAFTTYDGDTGVSALNLLDISTGEPLLDGLIEGGEYPILSSNGRILLYFSYDDDGNQIITALDLATRAPVGQPGNADFNRYIESGQLMIYEVVDYAANGGPSIHLLNTSTGQEITTLIGEYLNMVREGEVLVYQNNGVNLFDTVSNQSIGEPIQGTYLGISKDGRTLVTRSDTDAILLWDLSSTWPLGELVSEKTDPASSAILAPDGSTLAWIGRQGIVLQDVVSGAVRNNPSNDHFGNESPGDSPRFSPDGRMLAIGNYSTYTTTLWDLNTQIQIGGEFPGAYPVFSPDGRMLAIGNDNTYTTTLWDLNTQTQIGGEFPSAYPVFSPNSRVLAIGNYRTYITTAWDLETQTQIGGEFPGLSPTFSPDGKTLAIGDNNTYITTLWDLDTQTQVGGEFPGSYPVFSLDGRTLAIGNYNTYTTTIWDLNTQIQMGGEYPGTYSNFSPDGRTLAIGNYNTYTTTLWDLNTQTQMGGELSGVYPIFSLDGRILAIGNYDTYTTIVWDMVTQRQIGGEFPGSSPSFNLDGKLAIGDFNTGITTLWDLDNKNLLIKPAKGFPIPPSNLTFSSDGKHLASFASDGIVLRNLDANTSIRLDAGEYTGQFTNMSFYADDKRFIALGQDGTLLTWDVSTGTLTIPDESNQPLKGLSTSLPAFSPNGNYLVYEKENRLSVWNVIDSKPYADMPDSTNAVREITFSPDGTVMAYSKGGAVILYSFPELIKLGDLSTEPRKVFNVGIVMENTSVRYLITLDEAGDTQIWDWATRTKIGDPMSGNLKFVGSSTQDRMVVYINSDGRLIKFKWDLEHATWQKLLCPLVRRNFTQEEWKLYFPDTDYPSTEGTENPLTCPDYPPGP